jgi:hypothetical protein
MALKDKLNKPAPMMEPELEDLDVMELEDEEEIPEEEAEELEENPLDY